MQVGNEGVPHFAQACGLTWIGSASLDDQPADVQISLPAGSAARRLGAMQQIGNHRLICSDSTKRDTYQRLVVIEVRPQTDLFGPMG
jgi:hypothetical protein